MRQKKRNERRRRRQWQRWRRRKRQATHTENQPVEDSFWTIALFFVLFCFIFPNEIRMPSTSGVCIILHTAREEERERETVWEIAYNRSNKTQNAPLQTINMIYFRCCLRCFQLVWLEFSFVCSIVFFMAALLFNENILGANIKTISKHKWCMHVTCTHRERASSR